MKDFPEFLSEWQHHANESLNLLIEQQCELPTRLRDAIRYSLTNGGKRLRPVIVYSAAIATGGITPATKAAACAVECIHAYSLIHDDLPAMDDDDLRRGQPTCHIAYDEATAILAGDALQAMAFECIAADTTGNSAKQQLHMVRVLAEASGISGMVGGQALDIAAIDKRPTEAELEQLHRMKTGALIKASAILGALSAGETNKDKLGALGRYAELIGLAFQIHDDVLDVTGSTEEIGKNQGSDAALNKVTYATLLGVNEASERSLSLIKSAKEQLNIFGESAHYLSELADFVVERNH